MICKTIKKKNKTLPAFIKTLKEDYDCIDLTTISMTTKWSIHQFISLLNKEKWIWLFDAPALRRFTLTHMGNMKKKMFLR